MSNSQGKKRPPKKQENSSGKKSDTPPKRRSQSVSHRNKRNHTPRRNYSECPVCGKFVRELNSAITHKKSGIPAHFECIIKEIGESEELQPGERICYLGSGSFGILQFRNPSSPIRFFIRKRIQYEERDKEAEKSKIPTPVQ